MVNNNNQGLYNLLLDIQRKSKKILIKTKSNLIFITENLQVLSENSVLFNDKKGDRIYLAINEIASLTEVHNDGD